MMVLDDTYAAIDAALNITDSLKENFKDLITIFHNTFKNVDLSNFNQRIKTLKIKSASKFITKIECEYVPSENTLYVNPKELENGDAKNGLMQSLLKMITANDNFYGLNDNGKLEALNIGLTAIIADFLVGNESDIDE